MKAYTHCHYCGTPYSDDFYPHTCKKCQQIVWVNLAPVVVVLVPFIEGGLLGTKRAIEPGLGKWAFPSGYIELGETWQQAGVRELEEETGIKLSGLSDAIDVISVDDVVLIVAMSLLISLKKAMDSFKPNSEVSELIQLKEVVELAFPAQTKLLAKHLHVHQ